MPKGGARPKVRESDQRGGARHGSGPHRRRFRLDAKRAEKFAEVAQHVGCSEQALFELLADEVARSPLLADMLISRKNDIVTSK
jgi:hypothetical protein